MRKGRGQEAESVKKPQHPQGYLVPLSELNVVIDNVAVGPVLDLRKALAFAALEFQNSKLIAELEFLNSKITALSRI